MLSADNLYNQFGTRSGPKTVWNSDGIPDRNFEKGDIKNNQLMIKVSMQHYPEDKVVDKIDCW